MICITEDCPKSHILSEWRVILSYQEPIFSGMSPVDTLPVSAISIRAHVPLTKPHLQPSEQKGWRYYYLGCLDLGFWGF